MASLNETQEIKALCDEYKDLNVKLRVIGARVESIKNRITELSNGKHVISSGVDIKTYEKKGTIDFKKIKQVKKMIENGDIEYYRGPNKQITSIRIIGG